jgi:hypothetical protein
MYRLPVVNTQLTVKIKFYGHPQSNEPEIRRISLPLPLNLLELKKRLNAMFPEYNDGDIDEEFAMKYVDDEKELVTIASQEELNEALRVLGHSKVFHLLVVKKKKVMMKRNNGDNEEEKEEKKEKKKKNTPLVNPDPSKIEKVCENQNPYHGAVCDNCNRRIFGIRYKCGNCEDFDLCSECESKGVEFHHHPSDHLFVKIRKPLPPFTFQRRMLLPNNLYEPPRWYGGLRHRRYFCPSLRCEWPTKMMNNNDWNASNNHKDNDNNEPLKIPVSCSSNEKSKKEELKQEPKKDETKQEPKKDETKQEPKKDETKQEPKKDETKHEQKEDMKGRSNEEPRLSSRFEVMINTLESMGFQDRRQNIEVLVRHGGNLEAAVNDLLGSHRL